MRVLFLDVDGVLNSAPDRRGGKPTGGILGVDDDKLEILRDIVRQSGAFIVLTSTWKQSWGVMWQPGTLRYLTDKLQQKNMEIMGCTMERIPGERGTGIQRWLAYHGPVDGWAVLDDDIFPDFAERGILPRLIKTNFYRGGLTRDKIDPCVRMLNTPPGADIGCGSCPYANPDTSEDNDKTAKRCPMTNCPTYHTQQAANARKETT